MSCSPSQFGLVLFPEAVSLGEEVPCPALVHVPDQGLLASVVVLVLLDQVLEEEQVVCQVVLLLHVSLKPVRDLVEVVLANAADEAVILQLLLHAVHLVTEGSEGVNDEALNDGQEDECDEEVEGEVEDNPVVLQLVTVWRLDLVPDASARSDSLVEVEDEAGEHVVTLGEGSIKFPSGI